MPISDYLINTYRPIHLDSAMKDLPRFFYPNKIYSCTMQLITRLHGSTSHSNLRTTSTETFSFPATRQANICYLFKTSPAAALFTSVLINIRDELKFELLYNSIFLRDWLISSVCPDPRAVWKYGRYFFLCAIGMKRYKWMFECSAGILTMHCI